MAPPIKRGYKRDVETGLRDLLRVKTISSRLGVIRPNSPTISDLLALLHYVSTLNHHSLHSSSDYSNVDDAVVVAPQHDSDYISFKTLRCFQ